MQCVALDEDQLAAGDVVVSRFSAHTDGWERVGAKCGVQLQGMVRCQFGRTSNKMIAAEMVFDVMGVFQQLQVPLFAPLHLCVDRLVADGIACAATIQLSGARGRSVESPDSSGESSVHFFCGLRKVTVFDTLTAGCAVRGIERHSGRAGAKRCMDGSMRTALCF